MIMTLERLMELYQAEQQGKQIMVKVFEHGYYESREYISKINLLDEELNDLVFNERDDEKRIYFIKDEEDEYGNKLNHKK